MPHRELLRRLLGPVDDGALDAWDRAVAGLDGGRAAVRAALAERYRDVPPAELPGRLRHVGREGVAAARAEHGDAGAAVELGARDVLLHELVTLEDDELAGALAHDSQIAAAALEALRDPDEHAAARVARALPLVAALAVPAPPAVEHEPPPEGTTPRPLLDHAIRAIGRRLLGLERRDRALFQRGDALSADGFARAAAAVERVCAAGLLPAVRLALLHDDVAKGGDDATRRRWQRDVGDLGIHNLASSRLLERDGRAIAGADRALVVALVESHGLAGQSLRGETPRSAFAPLLARIGALRAAVPAELVVECLHVVNVVDTAAVRDGLLDDALLAGLERIRDWLAARAPAAAGDRAALEADLLADDLAAAGAGDVTVTRRALADRLTHLRGARQRAGEPRADVEAAVGALSDDEVAALARALATCQLWYCEAATGALTPAAQLRVLAAACGAARRAGVDLARPWHAQLLPLVARLGASAAGLAGAQVRYRRRLVEAALAGTACATLLSGAPDADRVLGAFQSRLGDDAAVTLDLQDSPEAGALITLLAIYESRSSASFHATLKALCDLYHLRKDDFDRVANEAEYLATMNAARDDKARMLDLVRPGRIVEVGPGGGVVLDLLEDRFGDSEIIGIDVSSEVVQALAARRARDGRRWRVIEADAFALADHVGEASVDTVVYCSVLHEIYSYVEYPGDDGSPPRRFRLEAVRDLLRATWRALRPGGRIVIRDGVAPPPGTRRIRFLAADGRDFFALYAAQFEGFPIAYRDLPDGRVELSAHAAMAFLFTYTWGPASFPYEVREQYGVLPYDAYCAAIAGWLDGARIVALPPALASYLQPGYVTSLGAKVELTDERDRPVPLPDSNCLIVVEKPAAVPDVRG